MIYLEYFLAGRAHVIWRNRHLPSVSFAHVGSGVCFAHAEVMQYLGPSAGQLGLLFVLVVVNSLLLFAMSVLLVRTLWCLGANTTTIEGWEVERHSTLLRRARISGGYLDGPNGQKVRITKQEFPWDIGIFSNVCQGMGSRNAFAWFWPFSASPSVESGLHFEDNGLEGMIPPLGSHRYENH